jgi:hypothetical protein
MPIKKRKITVTLNFDKAGKNKVVLSEMLNMHVRIEKNVLALQNTATVEVSNIGEDLRVALLSQFTAYQKRQASAGQTALDWIGVVIEAGYYTADGKGAQTAVIYRGEVVQCDLVSPPPTITVRITAYTRQQDKTKFVQDPAPYKTTFSNYIKWAAGQMGLGSSYKLDSVHAGDIVTNPARSRYTASSLVWDIQDYYKPDVAAYIDDDFLYVIDRNKVVNPKNVTEIDTFIGTPNWTEWGVDFKSMFDLTVKIAGAVKLKSSLNPGLNNNYVITRLDYELASRDTPFYVRVIGSPPAT